MITCEHGVPVLDGPGKCVPCYREYIAWVRDGRPQITKGAPALSPDAGLPDSLGTSEAYEEMQ